MNARTPFDRGTVDEGTVGPTRPAGRAGVWQAFASEAKFIDWQTAPRSGVAMRGAVLLSAVGACLVAFTTGTPHVRAECNFPGPSDGLRICAISQAVTCDPNDPDPPGSLWTRLAPKPDFVHINLSSCLLIVLLRRGILSCVHGQTRSACFQARRAGVREEISTMARIVTAARRRALIPSGPKDDPCSPAVGSWTTRRPSPKKPGTCTAHLWQTLDGVLSTGCSTPVVA